MSNNPKTVQELIDYLTTLPPDRMVRAGLFDTWTGSWKLSLLATTTLFTDEEGGRDLTDREREADRETLVIY